MAPDKSLAAEIEASDERASRGPAALADELQRLVDRYGAGDGSVDRLVTLHFDTILDALRGAEIAALQSRAFEDGARWMRDQAAETARHRYSPLNTERFIVNGETVRTRHGHDLFVTIEEADRHASERVAAILALPLQPEGERNA